MSTAVNQPVTNAKSITLFILLATVFVDSIGWGIAFPVFAPIIIDNKIHLFSAALSHTTLNIWYEVLIGIYCVFMFLGAPILGALSDKYGRKGVLVLSVAGTGIGFLLCMLAISIKSLSLLIIARILDGITAGVFPICQAGLADLSTIEELPKRLSQLGLANGLGFICGPIAGGLLISGGHYSLPFLLPAVFAFMITFAIPFYYTEQFTPDPSLKINVFTGFINIKKAFTEPKTKFAFTVFLLFFVAYTVYFGNFAVLLTSRFSASGQMVGIMQGYFAAVFIFSLLVVFPKIQAKFAIPKLIISSLLIQVLSYIALYFAHAEWMLWLVLAPVAITVPFIYVSCVTLISGNTDASEQGNVLGVVGSVIAFTWGLGPMLSALGDKQAYTLPYVFAIAIMLLVTVLAVVKRNGLRLLTKAE